jgi:hypothetical protein
VHLPGGGVTNDGPSAGAATLAALVSILTGKPVPGDVAVTGEVDLHGNVLPVGALPAKLISAQAGNIRAVLVPAGNNHDDSISVPVTNVREVLRHLGLIDQGATTSHAPAGPLPHPVDHAQERPSPGDGAVHASWGSSARRMQSSSPVLASGVVTALGAFGVDATGSLRSAQGDFPVVAFDVFLHRGCTCGRIHHAQDGACATGGYAVPVGSMGPYPRPGASPRRAGLPSCCRGRLAAWPWGAWNRIEYKP